MDPTRHAQDRDAMMARRLVDLARSTLLPTDDDSAQLDRVVEAIGEVAPSIEVGAVLLDADGVPHLRAATRASNRIQALFRLQQRRGGPSIACLRSGQPVSVTDLEHDSRWAPFRRMAQSLDVSQVHALPMREQGEVLGSLTLVAPRDSIGVTESDLQVAQAVADLVAFGILLRRASAGAATEARQLREALHSRVVIEQAKGMLAEWARTDVGAAFTAMRSYSRRHRQRLVETASALLDGSLSPEDVLRGSSVGVRRDRAAAPHPHRS